MYAAEHGEIMKSFLVKDQVTSWNSDCTSENVCRWFHFVNSRLAAALFREVKLANICRNLPGLHSLCNLDGNSSVFSLHIYEKMKNK